MTEACQILTDLSERGVRFGLGAAIHDWNDPFGRLFLQTLAMVAVISSSPVDHGCDLGGQVEDGVFDLAA